MISFFTSFDVKGTEEQLYMGVQLFKAFGFPFRLTVADAQQDDDGETYIHASVSGSSFRSSPFAIRERKIPAR